MKELISRLDLIHPLSDSFRTYLEDAIQTKTVHRNDWLLREGRICSQLYFIEKGLFRIFYMSHDKEVSSHFLKEGQIIFSAESFLNQAGSPENILALEDSAVHYLSYHDLQYAYGHFHESNIIARKLLEQSVQQKEWWLRCMRMQRASEKYAAVLKHFPELVQRVPAKFLASYLGITEVRLSAVKNQR
jgi:CRP-like cAMP-binding protein